MSKEDRIQPGGPPNNDPMVHVPLDEYLDLLAEKMGAEPKVVRTRAERARDALAKITAEASRVLPNFMVPKLRERERTKNRCRDLRAKIYRAVRKVNYYSGSDEFLHFTFDEAYHHYRYYYDPEARDHITKFAQEHEGDLLNEHFSPIPQPAWKDSPVLTEYKYQLPLEVRPLLPLYIATYFVPRPSLPFPQELLPQ